MANFFYTVKQRFPTFPALWRTSSGSEGGERGLFCTNRRCTCTWATPFAQVAGMLAHSLHGPMSRTLELGHSLEVGDPCCKGLDPTLPSSVQLYLANLQSKECDSHWAVPTSSKEATDKTVAITQVTPVLSPFPCPWAQLKLGHRDDLLIYPLTLSSQAIQKQVVGQIWSTSCSLIVSGLGQRWVKCWWKG